MTSLGAKVIQCDVLVIGAGVIGCAIGLRSAQRGRAVTIVDALGQPGHGSTSASSAIIRFHYRSLDSAALAWDSNAAWADWTSEIHGVDPAGMPDFRSTGALMLGGSEDFAEIKANLDALGIPSSVLDGDQIRRRWPAIDPSRLGPPRRPDDPEFWAEPQGTDLIGLYTEHGGYVADPQRAAGSYAWAAKRLGASFMMRTRVAGLHRETDGTWLAHFDSGASCAAQVIVNAAGPAALEINKFAGLRPGDCLLSRPLITETHALPAPSDFTGEQSVFIMDLDLGVAIRPDGPHDVHVSSLEPDCDPLRWTDDVWNLDARPTLAVYEVQALRAARRLPNIRIPTRPRGLSALYDVSPDWDPLIGRAPIDGLFMACGTSGNSFKTAPAIGELAAVDIDLMLDGLPTPEVIPLPRTGYKVDTSTYSPARRPRAITGVLA